MVPPVFNAHTVPVTVLAGVGDDGQPQWTIQIAAPLTTDALAIVCKVVTQQGGTIRAIAFVATASSVGDDAASIELSPQLQLKVQGATLATPVLQETLAFALASLL